MNNAVIRGDELNSSDFKQSSSFSSEVIITCDDSYCNDDDLIDNNNDLNSDGDSERNRKANNESRNSDADSISTGISLRLSAPILNRNNSHE